MPSRVEQGKKRRPTVKMKKTVGALLENGGNMSDAMRKAGYSDAMAKNPQKMMQSDTFQALLDKHLPDEKLLRVGREGLKSVDAKGRPDFNARHKYYVTGLQLRKRLQQGGNIVVATQVNVAEDRDRYS